MAAAMKNALGAINSPRHPSDQGTHIFLKFALYLVPLYFFPLFQTPKKSPKTLQKTHQSLLILPSSPRTQGIAFAPNLLFLGSTLGIWGLGVWMQLFQLSSTPLSFQIYFLTFIFLFTRIICFIAFFDMFLALSCFQNVFSLDPCSFMLVHMFICPDVHAQSFYAMFYAQIYIHSCLYVQIYMLRVLCHVSFVSFLSLLFVNVRVMCPHA